MSSYLYLLLLISFVNSLPPLQLKDEIKISDLFQREHTVSARAARYRLPTNVIPDHYVVRIRPILDDGDANQFTAPGEVTIRVRCAEATNTITLHSITILIDEASVRVTDESGVDIGIQSPGEHNTEDETYTISLSSSLIVGNTYFIYISYVAPVAEQLRGLYRSKYTNADGVTRWLATTQFERIEARRAFPCFDEPALRATFDMNIAYNEATGYHALCNMDIVETTEDPVLPGWKWSKYRTSVRMPSYLVAIVVSDFVDEQAPPGSFGDKPVKTWGQRHLMSLNNSGAYSALTTAKVLTFYEQYFDQDYDLPKMDSVAIPDFPFGAMENWGLITYREDFLLYFGNATTESSRRSITSVIGHEVGHQWFGNVVTMQWWNDVWLKEGFATYCERMSIMDSNPEFDSLHTGAIGSVQSSMEFDVGPNTWPVSNENDQPGQIIYDKGSSLIRMMNAFLTEDTMQKGLRNYVQEKLYGNAEQDDLFRILNEAAQEDGNLPGLTMKEVMDTWTLQTGYPLVKVFKASANQILISQERFKYQRLITYLDPNEYWWIPVTYTSAVTPTLPNHKPKLWIPKDVFLSVHSTDVNLDTNWIFVNPNGYGFYRVLYDTSLSNLLKSQLDRNASALSATSRSQLLDDYFTMAYNEYILIERALEFTTYLGQEDTLAVWSPVFKHLRTAYRLFSGTESDFAALKGFFSEKIEGALSLIGPEQTPEDKGVRVILRANLLDWACGMGTETCRAYATKLYSQWIEAPDRNPIPVDLKSIIPCAGVYLGGPTEINFVKQQFNNSSPGSTDREMWLNAMACSSNNGELTALLSTAYENENMFTKNEAMTLLKRIAANSDGRNVAFQFLENELRAILAYLNGNIVIVQDLFQIFSQYFNKEEQAVRMTNFVNANSAEFNLPVGILQQYISTVRSNVNWMSRYGNDMVHWFENNSIL